MLLRSGDDEMCVVDLLITHSWFIGVKVRYVLRILMIPPHISWLHLFHGITVHEPFEASS